MRNRGAFLGLAATAMLTLDLVTGACAVRGVSPEVRGGDDQAGGDERQSLPVAPSAPNRLRIPSKTLTLLITRRMGTAASTPGWVSPADRIG